MPRSRKLQPPPQQEDRAAWAERVVAALDPLTDEEITALALVLAKVDMATGPSIEEEGE